MRSGGKRGEGDVNKTPVTGRGGELKGEGKEEREKERVRRKRGRGRGRE